MLADAIPAIVRAFPWPKSMRWGDGTLRWVRPLHSVLCLFDGKVVLITGSPGGRTIINTVLETIVDAVDFGMNAQEAVDAVRFHHQRSMPAERRLKPGSAG